MNCTDRTVGLNRNFWTVACGHFQLCKSNRYQIDRRCELNSEFEQRNQWYNWQLFTLECAVLISKTCIQTKMPTKCPKGLDVQQLSLPFHAIVWYLLDVHGSKWPADTACRSFELIVLRSGLCSSYRSVSFSICQIIFDKSKKIISFENRRFQNKIKINHWPFISGYICSGTSSFDLPTRTSAGSSNLNSVPGWKPGTES